MERGTHAKRRMLRSALMIFVSVALIFFVFRLSSAGSLTPSSTPASTLQSLEDVNNALSGTFDSSGITGDRNGSAMQITKCIIGKLNGSPCP